MMFPGLRSRWTIECLFDREATVLEHVCEARPLDELHDEQETEGLVVDEVLDLRDVRALDAPEQEGLATETRHDLVVLRRCGQEPLDGHRPLLFLVEASPDLAHATGSDEPGEAIAAGDDHALLKIHARPENIPEPCPAQGATVPAPRCVPSSSASRAVAALERRRSPSA
jgi:hypothetical protein